MYLKGVNSLTWTNGINFIGQHGCILICADQKLKKG